MKKLNILLTGATGMVGEGVLLECLQNKHVESVLMVNRKHLDRSHPKLKELIIKDFTKISDADLALLSNFDACFFCAGISSVGMKEEEYTRITYHTTVSFAETLLKVNPGMVFNYVSGMSTDSSEKGRMMWARVKGRTENKLISLPFKGVYNFRPGFMKPVEGQKNVKSIFKFLAFWYPALFPKSSLTLNEVGRSMVNVTLEAYSKKVLEVEDIKILANKDL
jgi:uncharacterized protein YbjT (DUF2867 family)